MICPICGIMMASKKTLSIHLQQHQEEGQLKDCDVEGCGYRGNLNNLWQHKKSKHGPQKLICRICETEFQNKSNLNRHVKRIHEFEVHRSFKCETCGAELSSNQNLKQHLQTHCHFPYLQFAFLLSSFLPVTFLLPLHQP